MTLRASSAPSFEGVGAILFDMDGLLVDSEPLWAAVEADFARARGAVFTAAHAADCVGRGLASTLSYMSETFGFPVDLAHDAEDITRRFLARAGDLSLMPGAAALLDEAARRSAAVALGTSSSRRIVTDVLQAVGLPARFPVVVTRDDVANAKPAPDIFAACARGLGIPASRCVVLEDSVAGATAGHAAGTRVIAVPTFAQADAFAGVADAVVSDLEEARRLLFP